MLQEPSQTARIAPDVLAVVDQRALVDAIFNPPSLTPAMEAPSIAIACSSNRRVDGVLNIPASL